MPFKPSQKSHVVRLVREISTQIAGFLVTDFTVWGHNERGRGELPSLGL